MCENLILQIGRLDKNIEENLNFIYENKTYSAPLSSISLRDCLGKDKTRVVLIYPVSLPLNSTFRNFKIEIPFYKCMNEILDDQSKREEYLKNPQDFFNKHPHSQLADYSLPIHSMGNYEGTFFKASMDDFILYIFSFIIEEYLNNRFQNLYIDITSGLNIYITALSEALKYFGMWEHFYNIGTNTHVKFFITYSDPIIGRSNKDYNLYEYEFNIETSFLDPITYTDIEGGLSKKIIEESLGEDSVFKNALNGYLKDFVILYSALKNTAPLILYQYDIKEEREIKTFLRGKVIDKILSKYKENWKETFKIDHKKTIDVILSLAFLMGIVKLLKKRNISKKDLYIKDLVNTVDSIYRDLELYAQLGLFKYEVQANFGNNYKKIFPDFEWKPLRSYMLNQTADNSKDNNSIDSTKTTQLNERNFFAHAGFERNVTLIRKDSNNKLLLKYDETQITKIIDIIYKKKNH